MFHFPVIDVNLSAATSVVSKSQYATLKNVSPGRVSQWISEGKIESDALVGEGRNARINVSVADAHLRRKLDIGQRFGNGLSTRLSEAPRPPVPPPVSAGPELELADPVEEQIKREKLEGLQRENRKRAEEEAARAGRYTETQSVAGQMAKIATQAITIFEGSLPEIASAIAAKFSLPQRDILHLLRTEVRSIRVRAAGSMTEASALVPDMIEDEAVE